MQFGSKFTALGTTHIKGNLLKIFYEDSVLNTCISKKQGKKIVPI